MGTNTQTTSRAAYYGLQHKDTQETRIARLLYSEALTIGEIAKRLCMEKSTVSARVNGLRYTIEGERRVFLLDGCECEVFSTGKRKCSQSGVTCIAWQVLPAVADPQLKLNLN